MSDDKRLRMPDDPYCYPNTNVLINKLNIRNVEQLAKMEVAFTSLALQELYRFPIEGNYDFDHLCKFNEHIFKDIYEWAGHQRMTAIVKSEDILQNDTIEYAHALDVRREVNAVLKEMNSREWEKMSLDEQATHLSSDMAKLWRVHPFREGNTRTTIAFTCQFAESKGMFMDRNIFAKHAETTRSTLVLASSKEGIKSPHALCALVKLSLEEGLEKHQNQQQKMSMGGWKSIISKMKDNINSKKGESNTKTKNTRDER